ncbi:MAG: multicopper oxidase domain-containing protein [Rhodothermia bacterium]|nr:multicopper oxidase domain-containing protein [Rhodothermia bacterium]
MRLSLVAATVALWMTTTVHGQSPNERLIQAGTTSDYPLVAPNDNRDPAGILAGDTLELSLEIHLADWRPETPDGPGLIVAAVAEAGGTPMIPAPLIRATEGTVIRASVTNSLADSALTVFGFHEHPSQRSDSLVVLPGETKEVLFDPGAAGTYLYRMRIGDYEPSRFIDPERDQLVGAMIVDPPGGSSPDRVLVMNVWSSVVDSAVVGTDYIEGLTINGKSWPYTVRERPQVGDTLRWRVINGTGRNHPMHLHGFYYHVTSRGDLLSDEIYAPEDRRLVVTETMRGHTTMAMEWVPTRPGRWLFHCHLSFHVSPDIRLPGATDPHGHGRSHMAGLVIGIEVQEGPTDLIERFDPREITLYANEYPADTLHEYGFDLKEVSDVSLERAIVPGPVLVMKQHEPTYVTVVNNLPVPTGVHWHGLELDAWADGVPGWSASDGRVSPEIPPGGKFEYKLSLMRPGTFIYHSHLDDVHQLTAGLYGAIIVLPDGETYDPDKDHLAIVGWRTTDPQSMSDVELNGADEHPTKSAVVGEEHRIRIINIAPAGNIFASMMKDSVAVPLIAIAKDGADLPRNQQVAFERTPKLFVGEAADFRFTPQEAGTYELFVGYSPRSGWRQKWVVSFAAGSK